VIAALAIGVLVANVRQPAVGFLGAWFFLILAPSSSIVPINDLAVEHRMYLPLAAVVAATALGVAHAIERLPAPGRGAWLAAAGGSSLVALGLATFARNSAYADEITVWSDVLAKSPGNPRAQFALAAILADSGQTREAIERFRALEGVETPAYAEFHNEWGARLMKLGQGEFAAKHFLDAIRLDPSLAQAHLNLAALLAGGNYLEAACCELRVVIELRPELARTERSDDDAALQRYRRLVGFVSEACHVAPDRILERPIQRAAAAYEMGLVLMRGQRREAALEYFSLAERLQPDRELAASIRRARAEFAAPIDAKHQGNSRGR
jgi:tetratricopeptide (TPR) repeat protein